MADTLGPADPNAGFRAKLYGALGLLTAAVALLQSFHILTPDQGLSVGQILTGIGGLLGAGGLALASAKTNKQTKDGTFDAAPPANAAVTAVTAIADVANQFTDLTHAVAAGVQRVQDVAGGFAQSLNGVLPGSLVDQVLRGVNAPQGAVQPSQPTP